MANLSLLVAFIPPQLQDTFPIRAHNDSIHDTPAPTPTYSYYPSHHAHLPRISSSAPIKFALHSHSVSIKVVWCPCHRRSSAISLLLRPLLQTKSFISSSYFTSVNGFFSRARCISCTIRAVVFVLFVPIPPTLPSDFSYYSPRRPGPLLFFPSSYVKWLWSLSLVIIRVSTLGLVFCFPLA
jgi:hypothetical protein